MDQLYFDHAATTVVLESARRAAENAFDVYGNPSSVHSMGLSAKKIIDNARKTVASALYCKPDEIIFTGGGSESNNQAILGLAKLRARRSKRIITTDSEHPSVSNVMSFLEESGFEIVRISTKGGKLDICELENALSSGAAFVSVMLVNNETGAIYDIEAVKRAIDRSGSGALLHCDAVQGFLKVDMRNLAKNCDLISVSAHKIGGLKGVGALYCKQSIIKNLAPFIRGGGQENGLRSGTENVVGIAAFAAACEEFPKYKEDIARVSEYTRGLLEKSEVNFKLNLPEKKVDHILSVSIVGARSEVVLNLLNGYGICISAGSACSARKGHSTTLSAFGLQRNEIDGTVRISFGVGNTEKDAELLVLKLEEAAKRLGKK